MPYKTKYKPENPHKYVGNVDNIVCRSNWERKFCKYLDKNENIIRWCSEELKIPYYSTIDKQIHHYYPDFLFEAAKKDSTVETFVVEIKPNKQTKKPTPKKNKRAYLNECITFEINTCKWKAAEEYCFKNGWKFKILTEETLFKPQNARQ
jgi:isopentenyldiphosphate isomerase